MDYLSCGGKLARYCRIKFMTTPCNFNIKVLPVAYSDEIKVAKPTIVTVKEKLHKRLITGNMLVSAGYSAKARILSGVL